MDADADADADALMLVNESVVTTRPESVEQDRILNSVVETLRGCDGVTMRRCDDVTIICYHVMMVLLSTWGFSLSPFSSSLSPSRRLSLLSTPSCSTSFLLLLLLLLSLCSLSSLSLSSLSS